MTCVEKIVILFFVILFILLCGFKQQFHPPPSLFTTKECSKFFTKELLGWGTFYHNPVIKKLALWHLSFHYLQSMHEKYQTYTDFSQNIWQSHSTMNFISKITVLCISHTIWATSWENLFMPYANNKGEDQSEYPRSLISAFVVRCLDSIIPIVSISEISSLYLASVAQQADLSLTWSQTTKTGFLVTWLVWQAYIIFLSP